MVKNIVLPLISLAVGLISVFIDAKSNKIGATVAVLVLATSAILTGVFGYQDDQAAATQAAQQGDELKAQKEELALLRELAQHDGLLAQNEGDTELPKPSAPGASTLRSLEVRRPPAFGGRPIVQYFIKNADNASVTKALQQAGFLFVRVPGQLQGATNCIWIGEEVPVTYAKSVAEKLVGVGVQLRGIYRFRDGTGPRSNLIEIGSDARLDRSPVLTVQQIANLQIRTQE